MTTRRRRWPRTVRRRLRWGPILFLTTIWVVLWSDLSVANVVAGAMIGCLILLVFPLPRVSFGLQLHLGSFLWLLARFQYDLVVASFEVAYKSVAPWYRPVGRFITVQLRGPKDLTRVMTANFSTLVPGSVVVDVDRTTGEMMLHLFDAPDDDAAAAGIARVYAQEDRILRALSKRVAS